MMHAATLQTSNKEAGSSLFLYIIDERFYVATGLCRRSHIMLAAGTLVHVAAIDFTNRSSSIVPSIGMPSNVYELSRNDVSYIHTHVRLYIHTKTYKQLHTCSLIWAIQFVITACVDMHGHSWRHVACVSVWRSATITTIERIFFTVLGDMWFDY